MKPSFLKKIWNNFFTGLVLLLPLIITVWFVRFLLVKLNDLLLDPGTKFLGSLFPQPFLALPFKILILFIIILIVTLFGLATKNILGRGIFIFFEQFISKLPLVGKVYSGTKDISSAFLSTQKRVFSKVVLVEFPQKGSYALGFITSEIKGEIQERTKEEVINVYVPTTPNPTSGFLLFVPKNELRVLNMSVEDGLKLVISGGILSPKKLDDSEDRGSCSKTK